MLATLARHFRVVAAIAATPLLAISLIEAVRQYRNLDPIMAIAATLFGMIAFFLCGSWPWLFSKGYLAPRKIVVASVFFWFGLGLWAIAQFSYWSLHDLDSALGLSGSTGIVVGAVWLARPTHEQPA